MAYLSKQGVRDIINNAPIGTSPGGIIQALVDRGHILEGYPGQKKKTLKALSNLSDETFGRAANFFFGSSSKTIGTTIGAGVESATSLIRGKPLSPGQAIFKPEDVSIADIVLTGLELSPGGLIKRGLSKIPGAGRLFEGLGSLFKSIPDTLRQSAVENFKKVLAPTKEVTKKVTEKIAPELAERGVISTSREALLTQAKKTSATIGERIDEFIKEIPKETIVKIKPVLDYLLKQKERYIIGKKKINVAPEVTEGIDNIIDIITQFGSDVPVGEVIQLRRVWDKLVAETNGFQKTLKEGTKLNVIKNATNALRYELAKDFPDLNKLNNEFSFWKNVDLVITETLKRKTGQSIPLGEQMARSAGGVAGFTQGGFLGALGGAELTRRAVQMIRSPLWATVSANLKNKLADAIVSREKSEVLKILSEIGKRVGIDIMREITDETQPNRKIPQ